MTRQRLWDKYAHGLKFCIRCRGEGALVAPVPEGGHTPSRQLGGWGLGVTEGFQAYSCPDCTWTPRMAPLLLPKLPDEYANYVHEPTRKLQAIRNKDDYDWGAIEKMKYS